MAGYVRCRKCGNGYFYKRHQYLNEYTEDKTLCPACNAKTAVTQRIIMGGGLTLKELKILPDHFVFDLNGDDQKEQAVAVRLEDVLKMNIA